MNIKIRTFQGIVPRADPRRLLPSQAQTAENVDLLSNIISAIKEPLLIKTLDASDNKTIFPYNDDFLEFKDDVDVVQSPISNDQFNRIYFNDGTKPRMRVTENGVESEFDLGIPKPTLTPDVAVSQKASVDFTREWQFYYEEPDGRISQQGTLVEGAFVGSNVNEVTPGKEYRIATVPVKVAASAQAVFVLWFEAKDTNGNSLGFLYPDISFHVNASDFFLQGAKGEGTLVNLLVSPEATLTIRYDTSRVRDFVVDRSYVYTLKSRFGEEGQPSTPSVIIGADPTQDVTISNIDLTAPANTAVNKIKIYRTLTGDAGTFFTFVAEIDIGDASFRDTLKDSELGEPILTTNFTPPSSDLTGFVMLPGGVLAGFKNNTVGLSEPFQPHAFPLVNENSLDFQVVGLGVNSSGLVVMTEGTPYLLVGFNPASISIEKIDSRQSCESKRSIVSAGDDPNQAVFYASPDGLMSINGISAKLISTPFFTREQWRALTPSSMIAEMHDGKYFFWSDGGNFIFDFQEAQEALRTTTEDAQGVHADLITDRLLIIQEDKLVAWREGANNLTWDWKSSDVILDRRDSPSIARVSASTYNTTVGVTLNVFAENVLVLTRKVTEDRAFRIPTLRDEKRWAFEVISDVDVYEMLLGTSMQNLLG